MGPGGARESAGAPPAGIAQGRAVDPAEASRFSHAVREFETVFSAELQALTAYVVSQKGIFSTPDLVERAEHILPEAVRKLLPSQAMTDLRQAGRCLAFDLPTAAGFHLLRATEAVIRAYYTVVVKRPPTPLSRNWGPYIRILRRHDADPKILAVLEHIRALYRNPIIQPDAVLSLEEVTTLFGLVQSAILAMARDMEHRHDVTTSTALHGLV